jgi:hypothetical protein
MSTSNSTKNSVVRGYLNGKSFDQLANENAISKGNVFNIIKDWKSRIEVPDIDELREFSILLRKSEITIKHCAQSFRFIQILSNFGITDELDSSHNPDGEIGSKTTSMNTFRKSTNNTQNETGVGEYAYNNSTTKENFYYFLGELYHNCERFRIKPSLIIKWLQDLFEFNSTFIEKSGQLRDYNSNNVVVDKPMEFAGFDTAKKGLGIERNDDYLVNNEIQIPFISQIDGYIEQKKIELKKLASGKKKLLEEINSQEQQKSVVMSNLTELKNKERSTLTYLSWFNTLKMALSEKYNIRIEEEFKDFAKIINDFRFYSYDILQIIKDYKQIESLKDEIKTIKSTIDSNFLQKEQLAKDIESLEEEKGYASQSLKAYKELSSLGWGLKELKKLWNITTEISVANNKSTANVMRKFLDDVEGQYDRKLGFETKINELETKKKELEKEVPVYKGYLLSQQATAATLEYLYLHGVTNNDIIEMNSIVLSFIDGSITFDPNFQYQSKVNSNHKGNETIKRTYYWKALINELKRIGSINFEVNKQISYRDKLKLEIDQLNSQFQKINELTTTSLLLLNSLSIQFSYFIESLRQVKTSMDARVVLYLFHILVYTANSKSDSKDSDVDGNKVNKKK